MSNTYDLKIDMYDAVETSLRPTKRVEDAVITKVVEPVKTADKTEERINSNSVVVRYSPFNLDSKLAAMILLQHLSTDPEIQLCAVPYDHQAEISKFGHTEYIVGVDLLEQDLELIGTKASNVQIFSIRNFDAVQKTWKKLEGGKKKAGAVLKQFECPKEEEVVNDPILGHRTQSVSWSVASWAHELGSQRTGLWDYVPAVAKLVNLVLVDNYDLGLAKELRTPMNMARLTSLNRVLDEKFATSNFTPSAVELRVTADTRSQIARTRTLRTTLGKNKRLETYTHGSRHARVETMSVTESDALEMLYQAQMTMSSFISYEDVRTHRIWRVWAKDPVVQAFLISTFTKNGKAVWKEGVVTYIATDLPAAK